MSTLSRVEGFILKPIAITLFVLAITSLYRKDWWATLCMTIAWILISMLGTSLHPDKSHGELAKGTLGAGWRDKDIELDQETYFRLTKYSTSVALIVSTTSLILAAHFGRSWPIAIAIGSGIFLLTFFLTVLAGYGFGRSLVETKSQQDVSPSQDTEWKLPSDVFERGFDLSRRLKPQFMETDEGMRYEQSVHLTFECLFFFIHAVGKKLNDITGCDEFRLWLLDEVTHLSIERMFSQYPGAYKGAMRREFERKHATAESVYENCSMFDDEYNVTPAAILEFSARVSQITGQEGDLCAVMCIKIITQEEIEKLSSLELSIFEDDPIA
jgi:hypothetical protein